MSSSFVQAFNELKTIICMCPHCNNISRISDLRLRSEEKAAETWLDHYELADKKIQREAEGFEKKREGIRKKAIAEGRKRVPKLVNAALNEKFTALNYDPYDVKLVSDPIDFVIFDGMNKKRMNEVVLLTHKTKNPSLDKLHKGVAKAVEDRNYDWKVLRVSPDGQIEFE